MKILRIALWAVVILAAGLLGWLSFNRMAADKPLSAGAFGVPFALVADNGQPITQAAFVGKPSALFFGFTHCPEVCPTTLFEMNGWLQKVDPQDDRLRAFFVTVDPERDTPDVMGAYVTSISKRIRGISGPPDQVMEMVKGFRVYARKVPLDEAQPDGDYTMDHTASVFLLDAKGEFAGTISYGENTETAEKKLQNLMTR